MRKATTSVESVSRPFHDLLFDLSRVAIRSRAEDWADEHWGSSMKKNSDRSRTLRVAMASLNHGQLSSNTRRAYAGDLRHFEKLGGHIPCDVKAIANYLTACGDQFSVGTLKRRLIAIRQAHVSRGIKRLPTDDPEIKALMRGIRRRLGDVQRQAKPLSLKMLRELVRATDRSLIALRDRALLLLGFAGAFRRSELVALDVNDMERTEKGLLVCIRRSKTDQEQQGRRVAIPATAGITCPVSAVERWLKRARIVEGPIFRRMDRYGHPTARRLAAAYVSQVVKIRLRAVGVDSHLYSACSLRSGLVTEAAKAGAPSWKIRQQTGHRSDVTLARYIRDTDLWQGNAAAAVFRANRSR